MWADWRAWPFTHRKKEKWSTFWSCLIISSSLLRYGLYAVYTPATHTQIRCEELVWQWPNSSPQWSLGWTLCGALHKNWNITEKLNTSMKHLPGLESRVLRFFNFLTFICLAISPVRDRQTETGQIRQTVLVLLPDLEFYNYSTQVWDYDSIHTERAEKSPLHCHVEGRSILSVELKV